MRTKVDLRDSEIRSVVYAIPEGDMQVEMSEILTLLPLLENHLHNLIEDDEFFRTLMSASKMEKVFASQPHKKEELRKVYNSLQTLINDVKKDLGTAGMSLEEKIEYFES